MLTLKTKSMFLLLAVAGLLVAVGWNRGVADWAGVSPSVEGKEGGMAIPAIGSREHSVSVTKPLAKSGPRMDFEGAGDLYAYVQGLRAREMAGDPDAMWKV